MADDSKDKLGIETEKLRIRHAFLLSVFGLGLLRWSLSLAYSRV
jgi:hypothetical protein